MDSKLVLAEFVDHLAPRLDTYEQAIYLYALRHSRLEGQDEIVIGFKSARRRLAMGIGEKGKPMAERTCYDKLRSLQEKGCLRILGTERDGTRLRVNLPSEMDGLIPPQVVAQELGLEAMDFFTVAANRAAILRREGGEGGVEEVALVAIGADDAPLVGRLREIAARAAGHEDFHAGAAVFFEEERAAAAGGGFSRG